MKRSARLRIVRWRGISKRAPDQDSCASGGCRDGSDHSCCSMARRAGPDKRESTAVGTAHGNRPGPCHEPEVGVTASKERERSPSYAHTLDSLSMKTNLE